MKFTMQGVYTALITPFNAAGTICQETLISLLHRQEKSGVDGVVVLGTTGEGCTLDDAERKLVINLAVRELKGKIPIMVGCSTPSTRDAIEMAKTAQDLGADATLVVTPFYNKPTQEGIFQHYQAITQAVALPLCIYNNPARCVQNIEAATIARIAKLPNVIGVKESSGNFQQICDIIDQVCNTLPNFTLLTGDDPITLPMMAVGAHGVTSVLSNLAPRAIVKKVQAMKAGNVALAQSLHYALKPLLQVLFIETNPLPLKYLMRCADLDSGELRLPLCQPTNTSQEKLEKALSQVNELMQQELPLEIHAKV